MENRENLSRLKTGMEKSLVLEIMGQGKKTIWYCDPFPWKAGHINNPYKTEFLTINDKQYNVIYYYTDIRKSDGAITDDELTPLIFEDGKLIGWGWSFLKVKIPTYEIRIR